MTPDDIDQDKLAAEWASALEDQEDEKPASQSDIDALFDQPSGDSAPAGGGGGGGGVEGGGGGGDDALAAEWAAALADEEEQSIKSERDQETLSRQSAAAQFKNLTQEAKAPRPENVRRDLDFILDIPLDVSAELGRTKLLINELLQLGQGSVIELNKLAGEPLEIYVNGKLVARGEAVVINEKFGVRLTDIISPIERVKQLA
ncbi:flagellar motor switch protein FliN [Solidesulfovibrio fructosivorans JJ]]|uniref:Flagellar motor switch protein FliN n=1 Tax=Solidesulfovibrio fructosivorans JJ] TaxID=596151 RepID=E1JV99_SOLFR|nr:flagellar motor switch protein FliN [Solidesulfovibrio fructosivorans]EFL51693.1 flagellar motor switch protein FliN [Solidesulfovibrio fructosivorans JJ]]